MMAVIDEAWNATHPMYGSARADIAITDSGNRNLKTIAPDSSKSYDDAFALPLLHFRDEREHIIGRVPRVRVYTDQDVGANVSDRGGTIYSARLNTFRIVDQSNPWIAINKARNDFACTVGAAPIGNEDFQNPRRLLKDELGK